MARWLAALKRPRRSPKPPDVVTLLMGMFVAFVQPGGVWAVARLE